MSEYGLPKDGRHIKIKIRKLLSDAHHKTCMYNCMSTTQSRARHATPNPTTPHYIVLPALLAPWVCPLLHGESLCTKGPKLHTSFVFVLTQVPASTTCVKK